MATPQITFVGKGPRRKDEFTVMAGDNPPTITGGYAKWKTIDRPLLRGLTVFQGYDPATMKVEVRFGLWGAGWHTADQAGLLTEENIEKLEWMAGSNFVGGPSPFVYLHTYGPLGGTTPLIPFGYQQTTGVNGTLADTRLWPWVITGLEWGEAVRNPSGYRIRQDATVTVTNFQGFTPPPQKSSAGGYFTSIPGRDTVLLIASAPSTGAVFPDALAGRIAQHPKNNPMLNSRIHLSSKSRRWPIPHRRQVWVPAHQV